MKKSLLYLFMLVCSVSIFMSCSDDDWSEAAHGRAPAVATAIKRVWPDRRI